MLTDLTILSPKCDFLNKRQHLQYLNKVKTVPIE